MDTIRADMRSKTFISDTDVLAALAALLLVLKPAKTLPNMPAPWSNSCAILPNRL